MPTICGRRDRCLGQMPERLAGAAGHLCKSTHQAEALIAMRWLGWSSTPVMSASPSSSRGWTFVRRSLSWKVKTGSTPGCFSSFAYGKVKAYFISRGYRQGVEVYKVNPAYSSVIGRVKFMERYGLSVHQAAALVLARRLLGCSERIPRLRVAPLAMASMSPSPYLQGSE